MSNIINFTTVYGAFYIIHTMLYNMFYSNEAIYEQRKYIIARLSRASSLWVMAKFPCSSAALIPASPSTMLSLCANTLVSKKTMVFVLNVLSRTAHEEECAPQSSSSGSSDGVDIPSCTEDQTEGQEHGRSRARKAKRMHRGSVAR